MTSKKPDREPLFNEKDIERAVGSKEPIGPAEEESEASNARMTQLLVQASDHLRWGLLFRRRGAMKKYFKSMREYRTLLAQESEQESDLPTVQEYIAKLARTPSQIEAAEQRKRLES